MMCNIIYFICSGGPCELPATGDLWHREQKQPGNQGRSGGVLISWKSSLFYLCCLIIQLFLFVLQPSDDENSDNSNECVVCLSDLRDTLILPCRHLCLCNSCADTLRYQANNCPICRLRKDPHHYFWSNQIKRNNCAQCDLVFLSPAFRALLQIRAVRKKPGALSPVSFSPVLAQTMDHDEHSVSLMHICVLSAQLDMMCNSC